MDEHAYSVLSKIKQQDSIFYTTDISLYADYNKRKNGITVEKTFLTQLKNQQYLTASHLIFFTTLFQKYSDKKILVSDCHFFSDFMPSLQNQLQTELVFRELRPQPQKTQRKQYNNNKGIFKSEILPNQKQQSDTASAIFPQNEKQNNTNLEQKSTIFYNNKTETTNKQEPQTQTTEVNKNKNNQPTQLEIQKKDTRGNQTKQQQSTIQSQPIKSNKTENNQQAPSNIKQEKALAQKLVQTTPQATKSDATQSKIGQDNNDEINQEGGIPYDIQHMEIGQTKMEMDEFNQHEKGETPQQHIQQQQQDPKEQSQNLDQAQPLLTVSKLELEQSQQQKQDKQHEQDKLIEQQKQLVQQEQQEQRKQFELQKQEYQIEQRRKEYERIRQRRIQEEEQQQQEQLRQQQIDEEIAKKFPGIKITGMKVEKLETGQYRMNFLKDQIASFQIQYNLISENPFATEPYSFFFINIQNDHWISAILYQQSHTIQYLDSYYKMKHEIVNGLKTIVNYQQPQQVKWDVIEGSPQQDNGVDCGVFCLMALYQLHLTTNIISEDLYDQQDITKFRDSLFNLAVIETQTSRLDWPTIVYILEGKELPFGQGYGF